jgi:uncharacterized protein
MESHHMNAPLNAYLAAHHNIAQSIARACERIAPTWPLDQLIAVNPYWGWRQHPAAQCAAQLGVLGHTRLTMPRSWFAAQWQAGALQQTHIEQAIEFMRSPLAAQRVVAALHSTEAPLPTLPLLPQLRDQSQTHWPMSWSETVTHQISQHCAAYFDAGQARWHATRDAGLYGSWRNQMLADRGISWHRGRTKAHAALQAQPQDPLDLIAQALSALGIASTGHTAYLTALLLSINGWAAWCAYERWQARLAGKDDDHIIELLAIRLAWEWLLHEDAEPGALTPAWASAWNTLDAQVQTLQDAQQVDWVLQTALELAYQESICTGLRAPPSAASTPATEVQAVFCIDVRSEVFRRALEQTDASIHTRGFAGFFGLPIAYNPLGSDLTRPQLPGLLASAMTASEAAGLQANDAQSRPLAQVLAAQRKRGLQWRKQWADLRGLAASGFSFVETCGLLYGGKLLADSLPSTATPPRWEDTGLPRSASALRPELASTAADPAGVAQMVKNILYAMGLTSGFAPLVLLAGHGSQSANNPHAAGLDCGACGGQTGEVNARVLAGILNTPQVRAHLYGLGVEIPASTHFVPGLHNTTTDEVVLFDTEAVQPALANALAQLRTALTQAGQRARAERAESLGLAASAGNAHALQTAVAQRANDWAQVRPEWALANNAAFIVAPRGRTQHLNLHGRSFLHDYDWRKDADLAVLELIMTAPMVVTNWINLQYHASTVDNQRYGSGNKVLHNVVGGRLGVFEGNGGDLRIGLPVQSLHDGQHLRHTPLRLSVFIEAPRAGIETMIAKHAVVRDLIHNAWLHLLRIDPQTNAIERYAAGMWQAAEAKTA